MAIIRVSRYLAQQHANIHWKLQECSLWGVQSWCIYRAFQIGHSQGSISGCCLYRRRGCSLGFGTEFLTAGPMFLDALHWYDWSVWAVKIWLQPLRWQPQEKDAHLPAGCWQYMSQHVLRAEARWLQSVWLWDHQPMNILSPASSAHHNMDYIQHLHTQANTAFNLFNSVLSPACIDPKTLQTMEGWTSEMCTSKTFDIMTTSGTVS